MTILKEFENMKLDDLFSMAKEDRKKLHDLVSSEFCEKHSELLMDMYKEFRAAIADECRDSIWDAVRYEVFNDRQTNIIVDKIMDIIRGEQ